MRLALTIVNILEKISANRANSPQLGGVCIVAEAHHHDAINFCVP